MTCELQGPDCSGKVERRHDGRELCWMHWAAKLTYSTPEVTRVEPRPEAIPMSTALHMAKENAARVAIRDEIHERNGIVAGVDPLGRPCSCLFCQSQPVWER